MRFHLWITPLKALLQPRQKVQWLIIGLFVIVVLLEYNTPPPFVFGYLYIGAVLLASARLNRITTLWVTVSAVLLTLLNLVLPGTEQITLITVANRLITTLALIVTGWLSDRLRTYEDAIAQQQMQLLAQQKLATLREDFASTLTHDLKTPLLGAIETLKALQAEKFGAISSDQANVLKVIVRSHQTTLQLVETVLDIYRNDSEGLQLQRQWLDLLPLAEEVIASLTELASARQMQIHLRVGQVEGCPFSRVYGDALQMRRVFVNLIANAINHSRRGGQVEVVLLPEADRYQVNVLDEGQGISAETLLHLFERFYQGQGDRQSKGSGLGLYLSRQIIEAHGGKIWAEQRLPQGAVFAFCLPVDLANEEA